MGRPKVFSPTEYKIRRRISAMKYYLSNRQKCMAASNKWRAANIEKVRELDREWFHNNPEKMYLKGVKYRSKNKEKRRNIEQLWRDKNRSKVHAIGHRYRSKKQSAPGFDYTTHTHIEGRWSMFGGRCWICNKQANQTDHVKPLDSGGHHYPANLRPICISCNSRKKNRWPIPRFVFERVNP